MILFDYNNVFLKERVKKIFKETRFFVLCSLFSFLLIYPLDVFAEIFGSHYTKNKLVILYDAQDTFSVSEIHREIGNRSSYRNLHLVAYVWDCEQKIDDEYTWWGDIWYPRTQEREIEECESNIRSIQDELRKLQRLSERHRRIRPLLHNLKERRQGNNEVIIRKTAEYNQIKRQQEDTDVQSLQASIPYLHQLEEETKDFLLKLRLNFSGAQGENLKIDELIEKIQGEINRISDQDSENETNEHIILFLQDVINSLISTRSQMSKTEQQMDLDISSFFRNYSIISMEEQEKPVKDLALLIEEYMRTEPLRGFINRWEEKLSSPLLERMKNNTSINIDNDEGLIQSLQNVSRSFHNLRNFTDMLDSQLIQFIDLFIPKIGSGVEENVISNLPEKERIEILQQTRRSIQEGDISVYVSEWFAKYYTSYNYETVSTFLRYEENIQAYLKDMRDRIESQDTQRIMQTFIDEITEGITLTNTVDVLGQSLIDTNSMIEELSLIAVTSVSIVPELINSINEVSELFSKLRDAVENRYYGSPFHVLVEYISSRNTELEKKGRRLQRQITRRRERIPKINERIAKEQRSLLRTWRMGETWLPFLENVPEFYLSYNLYFQGKRLKNKEELVRIHRNKSLSSKDGVFHPSSYTIPRPPSTPVYRSRIIP